MWLFQHMKLLQKIHLKVANKSIEYKCNYLCGLGQIALRGVLQAGVSYNGEAGS